MKPKSSAPAGLPETMKAGIEQLSGVSMEDVKVHQNSATPAQLQAHAYAQGEDIHLAPGQLKHLPHESWRVVERASGRIAPTQLTELGTSVDDDKALETEAERLARRASPPS